MKLSSPWRYLAALGCVLFVQWTADDVSVPLALVLAWPVGWILRRV